MPRFDRVRESLLLAAVQHPRWYGASCAIAGAAAASIAWAFLLGATYRSTTEAVSIANTIPPSILRQPGEIASPAIVVSGSSENSLFAPDFDTIAGIPGIRAGDPLDDTTFCPLHERDDYLVEAPDILQLQILADGSLDEASCQATCGKYLIDSDGTIELGGELGRVSVAGKTLNEIKL